MKHSVQYKCNNSHDGCAEKMEGFRKGEKNGMSKGSEMYWVEGGEKENCSADECFCTRQSNLKMMQNSYADLETATLYTQFHEPLEYGSPSHLESLKINVPAMDIQTFPKSYSHLTSYA